MRRLLIEAADLWYALATFITYLYTRARFHQ